MVQHLMVVGRAFRAAGLNVIRRRQTPSIVVGAVLGVAGWSAAHPFVSTFGFNRETVAGLVAALAGSLAGGLRLAHFRPRWSESRLPEILAAAWLVVLPFLLAAAVLCITSIPLAWLASNVVCGLAMCAAALMIYGVPTACIGLIADRYRRIGDSSTFLAGAALGITVNALLLAPRVGLQVPLLAVAVTAAVYWFACLIRGGESQSLLPVPEEASSSGENGSMILSMCIAALVGAGGVVCCRALSQLMLESSALVAVGAAVFLGGVAIGLAWNRRMSRRQGGYAVGRRVAGMLAAGTVFTLLAAFPWLVDRHLDANAFISTVFWLSLARYGTVAGFTLPLGISCGLTCRPGRRAGSIALALAGGYVVGGSLLPVIGIVPLAAMTGGGLIATSLVAGGLRLPASRAGWAAGVACGLWLAVTAVSMGHYAPGRAAGLLFSTETFLARQGGVPHRLLPFLSESRILSSRETSAGTVTVWSRRGGSTVVRIDGVPVATTSRQPDWCPMPSADVMRVALPLLLHQDAESVLILGDPAGVAASTAAQFPVRQIATYDRIGGPNDAFVALKRDERVVAASVEPRLALMAQPLPFDVIVSDPGTPSVPAATSYFTKEFYAAAASTLAEDGIFCQRLRYADYGAEPLRVVAATMRGVFGEVMTIEIGSGEYAVLGVLHGQSLVREGLLERLRRPHARRVLATLGWDWCVPLNLTSVEDEGMTLLADEACGRNRDANGLLAYTLPQETMRWGAKWRELQAATVGRTSRLAMRGVPAEEQEDVLRRIADVGQQHRMMTAFPDQPWAYRKDVRTQLAEKPRGVIRPVAGEVLRERHPVDRRRIAYFEALGRAIHAPTSDNLGALEQFAAPYDPLVTYFLHHEIATLYGDLGEVGRTRELAHRLYTAYYADPKDRSVRDIAATLDLLVANRGLIDDDADRFDQFNGLIEVLLDRWESRGLAEPRSPEVVMVDIDISLDAVEATLATMKPLAASAGLTEREWELRQSAIERTLTRPLRKYRTSLLPHLRAAQRKAAEANADTDAAEAESFDGESPETGGQKVGTLLSEIPAE